MEKKGEGREVVHTHMLRATGTLVPVLCQRGRLAGTSAQRCLQCAHR